MLFRQNQGHRQLLPRPAAVLDLIKVWEYFHNTLISPKHHTSHHPCFLKPLWNLSAFEHELNLRDLSAEGNCNCCMSWKKCQPLLPRPLLHLLKVLEHTHYTCIVSQYHTFYHHMLKHISNWQAFENKPNLRGQLTGREEWRVEAEARPTIVNRAYSTVVKGVVTPSQHLHSITTPYMSSPCARTALKLAGIWIWAKFEGHIYGGRMVSWGRSKASHC